jgi:hypothetical protein
LHRSARHHRRVSTRRMGNREHRVPTSQLSCSRKTSRSSPHGGGRAGRREEPGRVEPAGDREVRRGDGRLRGSRELHAGGRDERIRLLPGARPGYARRDRHDRQMGVRAAGAPRSQHPLGAYARIHLASQKATLDQ